MTAPLAVALVSGGLDSMVAAATARADGFEVLALSIDYNQRHRVELAAAREIATALGAERHVVLPLDLSAFGGSGLTAGIAGLVAGAFSMAGGEYVSVSTQRDTEQALIRLEKQELKTMPEAEEHELADIYQQKGLSPELARQVARELTEKDALQAHAEAELGIDPGNLTSPWQAAWASLVAFSVGALLPLLAIAWTGVSLRVWACAAAVVVGLTLTGLVSARLGDANVGRAILRNVGVGALTMVVTYFVGVLFGVTVG